MTIINGNQFSNASAFYASIFSDVFQGDSIGANNYQKWVREDSQIGTSYEFDFLSSFAFFREWTGPAQTKALKANKHRIPTKKYEVTHQVSHVDFDQQPNLVASQLRSFLGNARGQINKLVIDKLVAGNVDLGYDGVPFFSTTHVNDDGLTVQSNYTTNTLTLLNYRAATAAMRGYTDGTGTRPLGIVPKKLIVGPALFDRARDILDAKFRTQGITANNAVDAATIVAAAAIDNVVSNDGVEIILEPMLVGTSAYYWFVIGEASDAKPMIVNTAKAVEPKDDMNQLQYVNPYYTFRLEAQLGIGYGLWQCAFASFATS